MIYLRLPSKLQPWIALFIGAILLPFSLFQTVIPITAWLAPIFLLRFARLQTRLVSLAWIWAVYAAALGLSLRNDFFPVPAPILLLVILIFSLLFSLSYIIDRIAVLGVPSWAETLVFPLSVTIVDFLIATFSPFATWSSPAYTAFGNLALVQVTSVTGIYFLTFLIAWSASVFNHLWQTGFDLNKSLRPLIPFGSALLMIAVAGGARYALFPPTTTTVRVAALTAMRVNYPFPQDLSQANSARRAEVWQAASQALDDLLARTRKEAHNGAKIITWSELAVRVPEEYDQQTLERIASTAKEEQIYLLAGVGFFEQSSTFPYIQNQAVLFGPSGETLRTYDKAHPVPGSPWDAAVSGPGIVPAVETPYGRIGYVICYDADFPSLLRQAGRAGVDILLVPAFDWDAIRYRHSQMATFRAVENGFSLVRAAGNGISNAVDYQGRVIGEANDYPTDPSTLVVQVPMQGARTVYPYIGDVFPVACSICLIILVVSVHHPRLRVLQH